MYPGEFVKHVNQSEFLLYQMNRGLSTEQRQFIDDHLQACAQCAHILKQIQQKLKKMSWSNLKTCQEFQQKLLAPIHGELAMERIPGLKEHVNDCELCRIFFQATTDLPDWQTVAAIHIEVPVATQTKIETVVFKAVKRDYIQQIGKELVEKIASTAEALITRLVLICRPIIPALVFRGEELDEMKVIEHPGGDLWLETGLKNVVLELTSIFEEFTVSGQTDDNGIVLFKNLTKGDYIVYIEGQRLVEVTIKSK